VYGRIKVYSPQNVVVGERSTLNEGVLLNARANITIGKHVHLSPYCVLNTGGLDVTQRREERTHFSKPILIHDGVWVGSGVLINPGVTIGEDSVIGAGSVITKDVPAGVVVVGNPGRILKTITFGVPYEG
jgi:acetyltransferase-like isoleucine patch superfamily enzyme